MTDVQYDDYCRRLQLSRDTTELIDLIRNSDPVRRPGASRSHAHGVYPSIKMRETRAFESWALEYPANVIYDLLDSTVIEYYEQAYQIRGLRFEGKDGRAQPYDPIPDFLVLYRDHVAFEEWKPEKKLEELAEQSPGRYYKDEQGVWHNHPIEDWAARKGLSYRIRTDAEIHPKVFRNTEFLKYYLRKPVQIHGEEETRILDVVSRNPGITIRELAATVEHASVEMIFTMIVHNKLYVDLSRYLVATIESAKIHPDQQTAMLVDPPPAATLLGGEIPVFRVGKDSEVWYNGQTWKVASLGERAVTLITLRGDDVQEIPRKSFDRLVDSGAITQSKKPDAESGALAAFANNSELARNQAVTNHDLLLLWENGVPAEVLGKSERTFRRWKAKIPKTGAGSRVLWLAPRFADRGDSRPKLSPETYEVMDWAIREFYESKSQPTKKAAYRVFKDECEKRNVPWCSYPTFVAHVNGRPKYLQTLKRGGTRMADDIEPQVIHKTPLAMIPDRVMQYAELDCTLLDYEGVHSVTQENLGRIWMATMVDVLSRRVVAYYLDYQRPTARAAMAVIRMCIDRVHRVPEVLVVDNGKEFNNTQLDQLCGALGITLRRRRVSKGRDEPHCERMFRTVHDMLLHNLPGNTQITRNPRLITDDNDPKRLASLSLPDLYAIFDQFYFDIWDNRVHPALGTTPLNMWEQNLARTGYREGDTLVYSRLISILTMPTTRKGTVKVQPGRGVKIYGAWYWADEFNDPELEGKDLEVRVPELDASRVHVNAGGRWVECVNARFQHLDVVTPRLIMAASQELRAQAVNANEQDEITDRKLAELLRNPEGALRKLKMQEQELALALRGRETADQPRAESSDSASISRPRKRPGPMRIQPVSGKTLPSFEVRTTRSELRKRSRLQ